MIYIQQNDTYRPVHCNKEDGRNFISCFTSAPNRIRTLNPGVGLVLRPFGKNFFSHLFSNSLFSSFRQLTFTYYMFCTILPMTGFRLQASHVESNHSVQLSHSCLPDSKTISPYRMPLTNKSIFQVKEALSHLDPTFESLTVEKQNIFRS